MKEKLFKLLLDQAFNYDFCIKEILNKFFPKEKPIFYADQICSENNFLQKLYLIKDIFHRQLKNHNSIFHITYKHIKFELSDYFYLSLLISGEPDSIIYKYDYNLIISIDNKNKSSENSLKKAMTSKIIIDLINNFKNVKDNVQKYQKELSEIEKENKEIIEKNIKEFKINLNIDDIICMKIDDIYIKIIESIILSDNFEDTEKIFSQLDLDVISITNIKFKELEIATNKENYIISGIKDLFNNEKINYYYILVKYIFKTKSSINNIILLKNFQAFLIKIITSQLSGLYSNYIDNETICEKRNYVVKFILNNEYYYQKYSEAIKLIELINYYKECSNESNKEEIISIENMLKNNKLNKKYETEYSNFQIIKYLYKKHNFKDLKEAKEKWMGIKNLIDKKALKEISKYEDLLIKCLRDEFIKEILIKIFPKNISDCFNEEISNIMTFVNNQNLNVINKGIQSFDANNENNGNPNPDKLVNEIRNLHDYSKTSLEYDNDFKRFCIFLFPSLSKNEMSKEIFYYYISKKKKNFDEEIKFVSNNIIFECKTIKKIKKWIEKIDDKNEIIKNSKKFLKGLINWKEILKKINEDFEIDLEFIFKREKDLSNESFYNISYECYHMETKTDIYEKRRVLIANISNALNLNNGMNLENIISKIRMPIKKENFKIIKEKPPISFFFKGINENNNIEDIKELNENLNLKVNNKIQIDENIYALLTQKRDLIIHWNTGKQYKIIGYSIEITNNKLYMIQKSYKYNDRVLLCCCKNQIKEKNGILFIEIDKKEKETLFNNITDFKVECMCLLYKSDDITSKNSNSKDKNNINDNPSNNDLLKKNYFLLIGGFDLKEKKPKVKLFQVLTDEKINNEEKNQMKEENIKGIRLSELKDDVLSHLEFESEIISINQKESEITIFTKENRYFLSFDINNN